MKKKKTSKNQSCTSSSNFWLRGLRLFFDIDYYLCQVEEDFFEEKGERRKEREERREKREERREERRERGEERGERKDEREENMEV